MGKRAQLRPKMESDCGATAQNCTNMRQRSGVADTSSQCTQKVTTKARHLSETVTMDGPVLTAVFFAKLNKAAGSPCCRGGTLTCTLFFSSSLTQKAEGVMDLAAGRGGELAPRVQYCCGEHSRNILIFAPSQNRL